MSVLQRLTRWADYRFMRLSDRLEALAPNVRTNEDFAALPRATKLRCVLLMLRSLPYALLVNALITVRPALREELNE